MRTSPAALLGIVFVVLKLCHVIDWSWWWVTCPFWGVFIIAFVFAAIVEIAKARRANTLQGRLEHLAERVRRGR